MIYLIQQITKQTILGGLKMERLKNVYKVNIFIDSRTFEKYVFSHSVDNAMKKIKVYFQRKGHVNISIAKLS